MTTDYYVHQKVIDEAIPILNRTIYVMNHDDAMPTPFLQDSIHHEAKKSDARRKTKYAKFYDGLHPDRITARSWLNQIVKAMNKLHLN